jgi:hypothetical protein
MKIKDHLEKWQRFDSARARFDPVDDFELWFWALSSAGTSLINAALHQQGLTDENRYFATQMPDIYSVPDSSGSWQHKMGVRCDLIHVGIPEIDAPLPAELEKAFSAMHRIEQYRNPCIRSTTPVTSDVIQTCADSYALVVQASRAAMGEAQP